MIYITGDTHREFSRLDNFDYQKKRCSYYSW